MRKVRNVAVLLVGLTLLGSAVYAMLIGVQGQTRFPRTRYTGTIAYAAASQQMTIAGVPTTEELAAGVIRTVNPPKALNIGVHFLNPQGTAYEGIGPNALYMEGETDLDGDGVIGPGESGVMLTGDLLEFGSATDPNTHQSSVDFRFKVTGGYLAPAFAGQNAGAYAVFDTPTTASWSKTILNARVQPLKCGTAIGDFVWHDVNGNGIQDAGEPGIDGVTVKLLDSNGNVKATTTTGIGPMNQHGYYEFSEAAFARKGQDTTVFVGFCAGTWQVQVDTTTLPAGFIPTLTNAPGSNAGNDSNPNPSTVVLATDISKDFTHDFGFRSGAIGHIGDFVWHDQDRDGVQDAGEPGIDGVTVSLRDGGTDALLATTVTGPNGFYLFSGLLPGSYKVVVDETTLPAGSGFTRTIAGQGTPATDSSDTPVFVTLTLAQMDDHTIDFGYVTPCTGSIGDFVWYDQNQNGIQDAGEPGVGGVTVNLRDAATDAILQTTTTAGDGSYHFNGLCGTFKVEIDLTTVPSGMSETQVGAPGSTVANDSNPNGDLVSVADGETNNTIDFGLVAPCTGRIGDFVWHDANGNRIQDGGEAGLPGVTVNLRRASDNSVIQTDISDANGGYMFEGLCPADYLVEVVPPENWTASPAQQGGNPDVDSNVNPTAVTLLFDNSSDLSVDFGFWQPNPLIDLVKSVNLTTDADGSGATSPGDTLTYSFLVTNTGNVTLSDVTVTDPHTGLSAISCPATVLAPAASMTCTATYVVTTGDFNAGIIVNTATVVGTAPDGRKVDDKDSAELPVPRGRIIVRKVTNPQGDAQSFSFTSSFGSFSLKDGEQKDSGWLVPGLTYSVSEGQTAGWDLTSATCSAGSPASIPLAAGSTVTCVFTNTKRGSLQLTKLTNGTTSSTTSWTFTLTGPNVSTTVTVGPGNNPTTFNNVSLVPGQTYKVCESNVPTGWTAAWQIKRGADAYAVVPFLAGASDAPISLPTATPWYSKLFDPAYVPYPGSSTNDGYCIKFVAAAGQQVALTIDNRQPTGDARTPGYWKNWNTCTGGNQAQTAAKNGGVAAGWYLLDDVLRLGAITIGNLKLAATDCVKGVRILDKSDVVTGNKRASEALFNLAAHMLAAKANYVAKAHTCTTATNAINGAQALLVKYKWVGTGNYNVTAADATLAHNYATTLDQYNNNFPCQ